MLAEETYQFEEAEKAKTNLATKFASLREQMEKAKADAVVEFKDSQSFIDACGVYYGVGFEVCLKQVGSIYPNLDLSKVTLDDPMSTTPWGGDTVNEKSNDSTHIKE